MQKKAKIIFLVFFVSCFFGKCFCQESICDLIDTQTAQILDYGSYSLNFKIYAIEGSKNGFLSRIFFGVMQNLNLGLYFDVENLAGKEKIKFRGGRPRMFLKLKLIKGSTNIPTISVGYDGQGYGKYVREEDVLKEPEKYTGKRGLYIEREKGFYLVLSKENLIFPEFTFNFGLNTCVEKESEFRGFVGLSYATVKDQVIPIVECDNIGGGDEARLNLGLRYMLVPKLSVELSFRDVTSEEKKPERIFRINYSGLF